MSDLVHLSGVTIVCILKSNTRLHFDFIYSYFVECGKVLTTKLLSQSYQKKKKKKKKNKLVATLKKFYGRHHDLVNPYTVAGSRIVSDVFANDEPYVYFQNPGHTLLPTFSSFRPTGMVGEACLQSRLGKRELILELFVRLFGLCLFRFVGFLFLLVSGKGCGL